MFFFINCTTVPDYKMNNQIQVCSSVQSVIKCQTFVVVTNSHRSVALYTHNLHLKPGHSEFK